MARIGATSAALFLRWPIDVSAVYGSNYVAGGYSNGQGYLMEALLTRGLVSVILGAASGAQNIGVFSALGVGAYIALAGLWGSPISGASMNPARTFGPDLVGGDFSCYWVYVAGPLTGALIAENDTARLEEVLEQSLTGEGDLPHVNFAAYYLVRGKLDDKLREFQKKAGDTPDRKAALTLPPSSTVRPRTNDSGIPSRTIPRTMASPEPEACSPLDAFRSSPPMRSMIA